MVFVDFLRLFAHSNIRGGLSQISDSLAVPLLELVALDDTLIIQALLVWRVKRKRREVGLLSSQRPGIILDNDLARLYLAHIGVHAAVLYSRQFEDRDVDIYRLFRVLGRDDRGPCALAEIDFGDGQAFFARVRAVPALAVQDCRLRQSAQGIEVSVLNVLGRSVANQQWLIIIRGALSMV